MTAATRRLNVPAGPLKEISDAVLTTPSFRMRHRGEPNEPRGPPRSSEVEPGFHYVAARWASMLRPAGRACCGPLGGYGTTPKRRTRCAVRRSLTLVPQETTEENQKGAAAMEPMPEDWDRAVAVVAHPDDLEYGVAAAIARWTGQGKQVSYLLATKGEAGIAGMAPDQVGPLRMEEERRSAAVVGVSQVIFLDDHVDGLVEYGVPLRRDLAKVFRILDPQVVITTSFDLTWGEEGP